jgi:hypothetical protein
MQIPKKSTYMYATKKSGMPKFDAKLITGLLYKDKL